MYEAYTVAVRVSLINGVSTGLLQMVRHFKSAELAAAGLRKEVKAIQGLMLVGGGLTVAGLSILGMFKPALDEAKKFQTEAAKFSLYGLGAQANREAVQYAKSMNVMGSSFVDNMRIMNEAQGIFREGGQLTIQQQLAATKIAAPVLAKLAFIESSLNPEERGRAHSQDLAMLRFIEARGGANNPATFAAIADWGFRLSKSSGGVVAWDQLRQLTATAGSAGYNLSQNGISALEPVIADMGGGRSGSGLRVAFQRLLGTQRGMPKQAVSEYLSLGAWDPTKVQLNGGGGIQRFLGKPGDVLKDSQLFGSDPVGYYIRDFLPMIAKKYGQQILGDSAQARIERAAEISMFFGPGTASAVFSQIDKQLPAIQRSLGAQNKQLGIGAAYDVAGRTVQGKQLAADKEFHDLLEETGEVVLPIVNAGLTALLPTLKAISNFAQDHPKVFAGIVDVILAAGALSLTVGALTMGAGALRAIGLAFRIFLPGSAVMSAVTSMPLVADGVWAIGTAVAGIEVATLLPLAAGIVAVGAALFGAYKLYKYAEAQRNADHGPKDPNNPHPHNQFTPGAGVGHLWGSSFVRPAGRGGASHIRGAVYLDKRQVGEMLASYLGESGHVEAGVATFDQTMAPSPPGLQYRGGFA